MGSTVNYARQKRFFNKRVLIQAPSGHDALTMYAEALMWLACFAFAIATCSWTVFEVNDYLQKLGNSFNGLGVQVRKHRDQCCRPLSACSFAIQSLRSLEGNLTVLCHYPLIPFKNRESVKEVASQFAASDKGLLMASTLIEAQDNFVAGSYARLEERKCCLRVRVYFTILHRL